MHNRDLAYTLIERKTPWFNQINIFTHSLTPQTLPKQGWTDTWGDKPTHERGQRLRRRPIIKPALLMWRWAILEAMTKMQKNVVRIKIPISTCTTQSLTIL